MKFTTTLVAALFSVSAIAAPAPQSDDAGVAEVSMMVAAPQWTIERMKRVCAKGACNWTFAIDTHTAPATSCSFTVRGSPATQANSSGNKCGKYTVSSGWSGQFGPGNGFTTLSVVDNTKQQIIYPAYTDKQLNTGKVVKPNQSYTPQNLP